MVEFKIGPRTVGDRHPPLVIAEIGINHEGSLATAIEMVDAAWRAGAEVIKHQTHVVADEMSSHARKVVPGNAAESIYDIMSRCALSEQDEIKLKEHVEKRGMLFLSTPFSRAAAMRLRNMNVEAFKIGSGECNNYPLLDLVASFGRPIILSTGMNSLSSISTAVEILRARRVPFALLHCTNVYPTPPELVRLKAMVELKKSFPDAVIGLSDHSVSNYPCLGAVALGASILERHFTDRMDRPGPDIACSMDPRALSDLIEGSRIIYRANSGGKGPVEEEDATIKFAFASVVTTAKIQAGEIFTHENLWVKRPGTGDFLAKDYRDLLGKAAAKDLDADVQLGRGDVL